MRILLAVDGSENSLSGVRQLAALRLSSSDSVTVLGVAEGETVEKTERTVAMVSEEVRAISDATVLPSVVQREHTADAIVSAAEELGAHLIIVGARGHSGLAGLLLGSVADRVLRRAPCPVLLSRPTGSVLRYILLGVDESSNSTAAAGFLRQLPLPADCEVRLLTLLPNLDQIEHEHLVVTPPLAEESTTLADLQRSVARQRLEALAAEFAAAGISAVCEVRGSDPTKGLLATARDEGADLLVLGSHTRGPVERFFLGGTSETVAHQAHCSVLVVKPA